MQEMPTIRGRVRRTQAPRTVPEAQVDDRRRVAAGAQGRRDVFEPQRLDAEEGPEPEPLVARVGADQQNVHRVLHGL